MNHTLCTAPKIALRFLFYIRLLYTGTQKKRNLKNKWPTLFCKKVFLEKLSENVTLIYFTKYSCYEINIIIFEVHFVWSNERRCFIKIADLAPEQNSLCTCMYLACFLSNGLTIIHRLANRYINVYLLIHSYNIINIIYVLSKYPFLWYFISPVINWLP